MMMGRGGGGLPSVERALERDVEVGKMTRRVRLVSFLFLKEGFTNRGGVDRNPHKALRSDLLFHPLSLLHLQHTTEAATEEEVET